MTERHGDDADPVVELIGIYNANGSLTGEIRYLIGKVAGRVHCGLCDITHGPLRRRPALDPAIASIGVPVRFVHADETTAAEAAACDQLPCVLARTRTGTHTTLLGPAELDACNGDIDAFVDVIGTELRRERR